MLHLSSDGDGFILGRAEDLDALDSAALDPCAFASFCQPQFNHCSADGNDQMTRHQRAES